MKFHIYLFICYKLRIFLYGNFFFNHETVKLNENQNENYLFKLIKNKNCKLEIEEN